MKTSPRRRRRTASVSAMPPPVTARRQPLPAGALQQMTLAHLRAHPELDFSPAELANALGRPQSRGAIIRACHQFTADGLATRTQQKPQRYQAVT
jgi:hypothetical protein